MIDPLLKARLAELSALAESIRIRAEKNQFWPGELSKECSRIANIAAEISQLASRKS